MLRMHYLGEEPDGHGVACQAYKVIRSCVVTRNGLPVRIIVRQPIRVNVMCLKKMQAISKKIHHIYKIAG